jgi:hypothetical protein
MINNLIYSPNTVLAKYLKDVIDIVQPRLEINKPKEISFYVGVNINGAPHIGTYLVQSFAFLIAKKVQEKYNMPVKILFGIHDNISYDSKEDTEGCIFHRTYHHALGGEKINRLINDYYSSYFEGLKESTDIAYSVEVYSNKQAKREFRENFLKTLNYVEKLRWCTAPSSGFLQVRIPCPKCAYSERDAAHTKLKESDGSSAVFECTCLEHGSYEAVITPENETYIDLNTLYRNIVKEFSMANVKDVLHVVIKGGDWVYSTETIDWALGILGYKTVQTPMRIFLPQVITMTGAKLSKSLISEGHESVMEVPEWMIDMRKFKELHLDYIERMLRLTEMMTTDPRHVFRSYSYKEIERLLNV